MPTNLDTLRAQPLTLIQPATEVLASGGSIGAWRQAMEQAIRRSQTAAYIAATAERLGVPPSAVKGLSRAERKELDARIDAQLKYLDGFVADLKAGALTMAQAQARANLYAGAVRGGFYAARYPGLNAYPGDGGTPCKGNCKCTLDERDDGIWWVLHPAEHCSGCIDRASGSPYHMDSVTTKAQTDQEKAMFAAMGGGGSGGGKGGGGGGSKLWPKGPDGRRVAPGSDGARQFKSATAAPLDGTATPVQRFDSPDAADRAMRSGGMSPAPRLNAAQRTALNYYQGTGHDTVNGTLRGHRQPTDQQRWDTENTTRRMDQAMKRSTLQVNTEVHRGMLLDTHESRAQFDRLQPGSTFRDPGYVSTSFSQKVAGQFGGSGTAPGIRSVSVRVRAPAGTHALYMPTANPRRGVSSGQHNEYELLLARNLNYRVVNRVVSGGHTTIELEVIP